MKGLVVVLMKLAMAAVAVVGVLAIGGVPALALTLAAEESPSRSSVDDKPGNGPPPHAASKHNRDGHGERNSDRARDRAEGKDAKREEKDAKRAEKAARFAERHPGMPVPPGLSKRG